jgi:hypothetical protein
VTEIVARQQARHYEAPYRLGTFTLRLLALLLVAAVAHAQPTQWESYQRGSTTYYSGTDANGGHWTGSSYVQWGERFFEFHRAGRTDAALPRVRAARRQAHGVLFVREEMSVLSWPALKPGELPLVLVLSVLIIVAVLNFRSPRKWVDMLLLLVLAGTGGLLAIDLLGLGWLSHPQTAD